MIRTNIHVHIKGEDVSLTVRNDQVGERPQYPVIMVEGEGTDFTLFPSYDQLLQIHATLGEFIKANPDKFVNKSITKLEEVK
jgi:hypothetical protein